MNACQSKNLISGQRAAGIRRLPSWPVRGCQSWELPDLIFVILPGSICHKWWAAKM
jgi:hypothetical protein